MKISSEDRQKIFDYQRKNYISYMRVSEKPYKIWRGIYTVALFYQMIINAILIVGMIYAKEPLDSNLLNGTCIATGLLAVGYIFSFFKLPEVSFLLSAISVIFSFPLMLHGLILNSGVVDIKGEFYWQYLIPMLVLLLSIGVMCCISLKERLIMARDYKAVNNKEYSKQFEN